MSDNQEAKLCFVAAQFALISAPDQVRRPKKKSGLLSQNRKPSKGPFSWAHDCKGMGTKHDPEILSVKELLVLALCSLALL